MSARATLPRLSCAVLALALGACITTDIRTGEDNRPPRIPFNQVDPKSGLVVVSDATTQLPMQFKVLTFDEPNAADTLTVRWFVDYHRDKAIRFPVTRPPEPGRANGTRTGSTFTLTVDMFGPTLTGEPHLVEVVVCDRPFDDSNNDPNAPDFNRRCSGGDAFGALLSWTVQVTQAGASGKPRAPKRALHNEVTDAP